MLRTTRHLLALGLLLTVVSLWGCPSPPSLSVTPPALSLGADRAYDSFQIVNVGAGTLSWQIAVDVDWLVLTQRVDSADVPVTQGTTAATEVDTLRAYVTREKLQAGTYQGTVTITSNGGAQEVKVSMQVTSPPVLGVAPAALDFGTSLSAMNLTVSNTGSESLTWQAKAPAGAGWLTVTPGSGTLDSGSQTVQVEVSRAGLSAGLYEVVLTVSSNGGTASIPVRVRVPARELVVAPLEVDFGTSGVERQFSVSNSGAERLDWRVVTEAPDFPAFVTVTPTAGSVTTETDAVVVRIDRNALPFAFNTRNVVPITVTAQQDGGTAVVSLVISVSGVQLEPEILDLGTAATEGTVTVNNQGVEPVAWTATEGVGWITFVTPSGTAPAGGTSQILVQVDRGSVAPGAYEDVFSVDLSGQEETVTVRLTELAPPTLEASPSDLYFGSQAIDKKVALWNSGIGTVYWALDTNALPDWLEVVQRPNPYLEPPPDGVIRGTLENEETTSLRFSVDRSGLDPMSLSTDVVVTGTDWDAVADPGNPNGQVLEPATLRVNMSVASNPVLAVDTGQQAGTLAFGNETTTAQMTIRNIGTGALDWAIDASEFPEWLSMAPQPLSGTLDTNTDSDTVTVTVNRVGLVTSGDYEHEAVVQSTGGSVPLSITMTVPQPVLAHAPTMLDFADRRTEQTLTLTNAGGGVMEWKLVIPEDFPWLTAEPAGAQLGTEAPQELTVRVNRQIVPHGDYEGYLEFQWAGTQVTRVDVQMTVPGPVLSVTPAPEDGLVFGPLDVEQVLTVRNVGDQNRELTWSITELPLPWLTANVQVGTTTQEADPVRLTIHRSGLAAGTYTGQIVFASNDGTATIPVTMEVAALTALPSSLSFASNVTQIEFRLENHLEDALTWSADAAAPWLALDPPTGQIPGGGRTTVMALADREGLATQVYSSTLSVTAEGLGYTLPIPVEMRVAAFELDPKTLDFGELTAPAQLPFIVQNISTDPLAWTASVPDTAPWLTLSASGEQTTPVGQNAAVTVTADPADLIPGNYTAPVRVEDGHGDYDTVTASMVVPAPPSLSVSPTQLDFLTTATDKLVAVWNSGVGEVNWTIDPDNPPFPSWLSVSRTSGTVPSAEGPTNSVRVSVDRRGLPPTPTEHFTVVVTAEDGEGAALMSREIEVSMAVAAVPILTVDTGEVNASADAMLTFASSETSRTFTLANTGTGSLNWSIDAASLPSWLAISPQPLQGSLSAEEGATVLRVQIDRTGVARGDQTFPVAIVSDGGTETVHVNMTVPAPSLNVTPTSLNFGEEARELTFGLVNAGGDTLEWSINVPGDVAWLTAAPDSGDTVIGVVETITVHVDRSNLVPGVYQTNLNIISNGGTKPFPITLTVPGPTLQVQPSTVDYGPTELVQSVTIRNVGLAQQTLSWQIADGYPHWLTPSASRGTTTTEQDVVQFTVNRSGLEGAGVHTGQVEFTSNGGTETVDFSVEVPVLSALPMTVSVDSSMDRGSFELENHETATLNWAVTSVLPDWLALSAASGSIPIGARATVYVDVLDRTGLTPGWHRFPLTIQDVTTGYEQTLLLEVKVPYFSLNLVEVDLGTVTGPAQGAFQISSRDGSAVDWTAVVDTGASWLTLSQYAGTTAGTDTVTLEADPAALAAGDYVGKVTVSSGQDDDLDVGLVVVSMTVPNDPALAVTPTRIDFSTTGVQREVFLWNEGIGTVNWRIETADFPAWLTLTPETSPGTAEGSVSGPATSTVTLHVDRDGVVPGLYPPDGPFQIEVTAEDDAGNPLATQMIDVQMRVVGQPVIFVDTGDTDTSGIPYIEMGDVFNEETFLIRNIGTATLFWEIPIETDPNTPRWLIGAAPAQGSLEPDRQVQVTVTVDRSAEAFGGYQHTFYVLSNDFSNQAQPVKVEIQVPKRIAITVYPTNISLPLDENSGLFSVANNGDDGTELYFKVESSKDWLFMSPSRGYSVGTASPDKDWVNIDFSVDRSQLAGRGATATIRAFAYDPEDDDEAEIQTIEPVEFTITVEVASLSFEVPWATMRVPSLARWPMLMRNLRYDPIVFDTETLPLYVDAYQITEKDVPLEITETDQFLTDGSKLRTNLAIVLDYSGSMFLAAQKLYEYFPNDPAFEAWRAQPEDPAADPLQALYEYYIGNLILELPSWYRITLMLFNDRQHATDTTTLQTEWLPTSDKTTVLSWLQGIGVQDHGASEVLPEIRAASSFMATIDSPLTSFDGPDQTILILMSDGRNTAAGQKTKDAYDQLFAEHVRLFAIGWGTEVNNEPLARIASETGGHYYALRPVEVMDDGQPVMVPGTAGLEDVCFTDPLDSCDMSLAGDLQKQVVFSYVSLNEENRIETRVTTAFDDPNDDVAETSCGLENQFTIGTAFKQTIDFGNYVGDIRMGQISMRTDGVLPGGGATVWVRADYVPRNIRQFEITLTSTETFELSVIPQEEGGLVWDRVAVPDLPTTTNAVTVTLGLDTDEPFQYGDFGDMLRLDFPGVTAPFDVNLTVDNSLYDDPDPPFEDKYFLYPNAIHVDGSRVAPAFPTPRITYDPESGIKDVIILGPDEDRFTVWIENIGGTYPYGSDTPFVYLHYHLGSLPPFIVMQPPDNSYVDITGGVGDVIPMYFEIDRDVDPGHYDDTIDIIWSGIVWGTYQLRVITDVARPVLRLEPRALDFGTDALEVAFELENTAQSTLWWQISDNEQEHPQLPDCTDPQLEPCITPSTIGGGLVRGEPQTVTLELDRTRSPVGPFSEAFVIIGTDPLGSTVRDTYGGWAVITVTVTGEVLAPAIGLDTNTLDFGDATTSIALGLSNAGDGTLQWSVDPGDVDTWIEWTSQEGNLGPRVETSVTVRVNRTGLPAGPYTDTVTITGRDGDDVIVDTQPVTVQMVVP